MRSFEYVTIEGQAVRVPVVVCAGGGVVARERVREPDHTRESIQHTLKVHGTTPCDQNPMPAAHTNFDAPLLARARNTAFREFRAKFADLLDLFTSSNTRTLEGSDAELRARARSIALPVADFNSSSISADLAPQRIYANGS